MVSRAHWGFLLCRCSCCVDGCPDNSVNAVIIVFAYRWAVGFMGYSKLARWPLLDSFMMSSIFYVAQVVGCPLWS